MKGEKRCLEGLGMRRESVTGVTIPSMEEGIGGAMAEALCPIRVLARVCSRINAAAPGRGNRVKSERKINGSGKRRWEMTAAPPLGSGADSARLGSAAAPSPPSQGWSQPRRWVNRENVTLGMADEPQLHVGKLGGIWERVEWRGQRTPRCLKKDSTLSPEREGVGRAPKFVSLI